MYQTWTRPEASADASSGRSPKKESAVTAELCARLGADSWGREKSELNA